MPDFLPSKDSELIVWSSNYSARINATPLAFGLSVPAAAGYQALHLDFETKLATASEPITRTRGTISAKDDARKLLKAEARELARIINAYPPITNQQRIDLGLTPRKSEATPINPPTEQPVLTVAGAVGRILKIKLGSADTSRRGKPDGVAGCSLFSHVGSQPPADVSLFKFEGSTTRTSFDLEVPASVPAGSQIWLTAFWFSPTSQSGPACQPVSAYVAGGVVTQQAQAA